MEMTFLHYCDTGKLKSNAKDRFYDTLRIPVFRAPTNFTKFHYCYICKPEAIYIDMKLSLKVYLSSVLREELCGGLYSLHLEFLRRYENHKLQIGESDWLNRHFLFADKQ